MKYKLFVAFCTIICVLWNCNVFADEATTSTGFQVVINSSNTKKNEIPIILNNIKFKEFDIDNIEEDDTSFMEGYKPFNLLSNSDVPQKGNIVSNSEIRYNNLKLPGSTIPKRWEVVTKLY